MALYLNKTIKSKKKHFISQNKAQGSRLIKGLGAKGKHLETLTPPPQHLSARAPGEVGTRLAKKGLSPLH